MRRRVAIGDAPLLAITHARKVLHLLRVELCDFGQIETEQSALADPPGTLCEHRVADTRKLGASEVPRQVRLGTDARDRLRQRPADLGEHDAAATRDAVKRLVDEAARRLCGPRETSLLEKASTCSRILAAVCVITGPALRAVAWASVASQPAFEPSPASHPAAGSLPKSGPFHLLGAERRVNSIA